MNDITVKLRPSFILWTIGIFALLALSIALKDIIIIFFLAFIVSSGFRPVVDRLEKFGFARILSLIIIYLIAVLLIILVLLLTIETFIRQFNTVNANLPEITENLLTSLQNVTPDEWGIISDEQIQESVNQVEETTSVNAETLDDIFTFLGNNIQTFSNTGLSILSSVTNFLFSAFIVIMVAAYLIARPEKAYRGLIGYIPKNSQDKVMNMFDKVERQLGEWVVGQLILMFVVGLITYLVVMFPYVLGVDGYELHKFALLIAIIAGILEAFPNIGPTITLVITMLMTIGTGGSLGIIIYIFIMFLGIQQFEAVLIVPMVMKRAVNLDPIIVILAITAGFTLGGVLGAIISIPITVILRIILDEVNENRIKHENDDDKILSQEKNIKIEKSNLSRVKGLFRKFF